ncbi:MAG: hypothetical protein ACYS1A_17025 [Planctomycetota bacterium]
MEYSHNNWYKKWGQASPHIEKILSLAKKTALEKLINMFPSDQKGLFIYRECLKTVKNNFGYPTVLKDN